MKRSGMKTLSMSMSMSLGLALAGISAAQAQTSVGVSIGINQPGVYGRINIGNVPPPPVVYVQPVVIVPGPVAVQRAPIYLYVPPTQQQNWSRYCARWGACGQPVYFVEERWVRERYERRYEPVPVQERHDNGRHRGWDKHRDRDEPERDGGHGKEGKKGKKDKHDD